MRVALILSVISLVLIFLVGCIPSIYPLYTDEDIVFNEQLLGVWQDPTSTGTWTFKQGDNNSYMLVMSNGEEQAFFEIYMVQIGGEYFLDLFPDPPDDLMEKYEGYYLPVHQFNQVKIEGDKLYLGWVDYDWTKKHPDDFDLSTIDYEDGKILTAQPKEMQAYIAKHLGEDLFVFDEGPLTRK